MAHRILCPRCTFPMSVEDDVVGKSMACGACTFRFTVPPPTDAAVPEAGAAAPALPVSPPVTPRKKYGPDPTDLFDESDSLDADGAPPEPTTPAALAPPVPVEPSAGQAVPTTPAHPGSPLSGKIHMQCPNCGLVVRGLPDVFSQPIRCPDCSVKSLFRPESVPEESIAVAEKPVWKKLPFVLGVGLSVAIVLALAALAYFRHPSRSSNPVGVQTKPRPTEPTDAEERTKDENPVEEPAPETDEKTKDENPAEEPAAETAP